MQHNVSSSVGAGKARRMHRMFQADGRALFVAMDHAAYMGQGPAYGSGLESIARGRPDGILATWLLARTQAALFARSGLVLRVDGGTSELGERASSDVGDLLCDVEDAVVLGADAVVVLAFPGQH